MKLETNHRKRNEKKNIITSRLNNMILRNQQIDYEIENEI